jgi:hypothetical protein
VPSSPTASLDRNQALGNPIPRRWLDQATSLARQLAATAGTSLVYADLHYGNVLTGTRIDELDDAAVRALLDAIVDASELHPDKAWAWTVVRAVVTGCGGSRSDSPSTPPDANASAPSSPSTTTPPDTAEAASRGTWRTSTMRC